MDPPRGLLLIPCQTYRVRPVDGASYVETLADSPGARASPFFRAAGAADTENDLDVANVPDARRGYVRWHVPKSDNGDDACDACDACDVCDVLGVDGRVDPNARRRTRKPVRATGRYSGMSWVCCDRPREFLLAQRSSAARDPRATVADPQAAPTHVTHRR